MYNPSGTYKGRPYIKKQTSQPTQTFSVEPTYKVEVIYDDDLIFKEGATEVRYEFTSSGSTGATHASIKNFKFDGKRIITFDLEFSKMSADDNADYFIKLTGLVGQNSRKEPMEITYSASNDILCSFRMNQAKNLEVFGRPTLIESEDLSLSDWKTTDGTHLADKLRSRIALITSKTTATEKENMDNLVKEDLKGKEIITSETYNISLNVCKKYVVKTGHSLQVSLGFPVGYGPDDAGVTFKAYHFVKDNNGNVVRTEEIPCIVTQYGLIITCDAFSPFSVVATKSDENDQKIKSIVLTETENEKINTDSNVEGGIITIDENASANLNIVLETGYEIESITACGRSIDITDKNSVNDKNWKFVTLNNAFIENGGDISKITFKVKENVNTAQESVVTIKNIVASNEDVEVNSNDAILKVNVTLPQVPEGITSDIYLIKDDYISRIEADTTVSVFKTNVKTQQSMVFKDKDGNLLEDTSIIKTGDTLQVDSKNYTLIVTGNIDGNGTIGTNDIAKLKLHYIEMEGKELTGIELIAADMDYDGKISLIDLAKLKLILIK